MAQQIKSLLVMMSLHVRVPFLVTVFLLQIQLPAYAYGNAMDMTQVVEAV